MTREEARLIAKKAAESSSQNYCHPIDTFEPHDWVIKAIMEAGNRSQKDMTEAFQAGGRSGYNQRSKMAGAPGDDLIEDIFKWHKRMFGVEYAD